MADYAPPVDKLLTLGEPKGHGPWREYRGLGLGPEHIPELARMVADRTLNNADGASQEVWAPLHAWRALGQFRAETAIEALLTRASAQDERFDDYVVEELPQVFAMIGPAALPALAAYLGDASHGNYARSTVAEALKEMAEEHPEARDECVAILTRQLERAEEQDPSLNAFLIAPLLDLRAAESAPVIERAYAAGRVDEGCVGEWEDIQWELGIGKEPPPYHAGHALDWESPWQEESLGEPLTGGLTPKQKAEARRKEAKKARKRRRKRK